MLFWTPHVALFVNESTLLPVVVRLAPAATVLDRFRAAVATVFEAHELHRTFIEQETEAMSEHRTASTTNRGVIGIMNEFAQLARVYRSSTRRPRPRGAVAPTFRDPLRAPLRQARQP